MPILQPPSFPSARLSALLRSVMLACFCTLLLGACMAPKMRSNAAYRPDQAETRTIEGVSISACLLPDDVAQKRYGADLASKGLQAVWLRIANNTASEQWLLAADLDPDYFTADEAAYLFRRHWAGVGFSESMQRFRDLAMRARLESGKSYEGHILIPRTEGGRYVEITINGNGHVRRFGFPMRTADGHFDFEKLNPKSIYAQGKRESLTRTQLRSRLEQLPSNASSPDGKGLGDPLNIVLIGEASQMMGALSECGWSFTHRVDWTTIRRELVAAMRGKAYLTAPVSPLHLFGRPQDLAFQRSRSRISQRNHMRLWLAPYTVEGRSVWVGQVSRDIGIKLTSKSSTLTTHVIDPMVDEARQFVLESLLFRYRIEHFGFVRASEPADREHPRANLTGDPYITDGMRLIVFISSKPVPAENVRNLGWAKTGKGPIEFGQSDPAEGLKR